MGFCWRFWVYYCTFRNLGLAIIGVAWKPTEALIALSIVFVAAELARKIEARWLALPVVVV